MGREAIPAYNPIDIHYSLRSIAAEMNIFDKLSLYNASLTKKCLRLYKKTYLLAEDERVPHIDTLLKEDIPDFEEIFNRDFEEQEFEEYLQKLCIINHIYSRDIEQYLAYGQEKELF